jgi:hypothetical protein
MRCVFEEDICGIGFIVNLDACSFNVVHLAWAFRLYLMTTLSGLTRNVFVLFSNVAKVVMIHSA